MHTDYNEVGLRRDLWDLAKLHARLGMMPPRVRLLKPILEETLTAYVEAAEAADVEVGEDEFEESRYKRHEVLVKLLFRKAGIQPKAASKPNRKHKKKRKKKRRR